MGRGTAKTAPLKQGDRIGFDEMVFNLQALGYSLYAIAKETGVPNYLLKKMLEDREYDPRFSHGMALMRFHGTQVRTLRSARDKVLTEQSQTDDR